MILKEAVSEFIALSAVASLFSGKESPLIKKNAGSADPTVFLFFLFTHPPLVFKATKRNNQNIRWMVSTRSEKVNYTQYNRN